MGLRVESLFVLVFGSFAAGVSPASAGLVGTTASVTYDRPALGDVFDTGGSGPVVAGGTSFSLGGGAIQVEVSDTNILITFVDTWTFDTTGSKAFDGIVLTDNAANITGVSVDPRNTSIRYSTTNLSFDSHNVEVNFPYPPFATLGGGESISLNVTTSPVPELSTWAMMALGFAGFGFAGWRGSGKTAALAA